MALYPGAVQKRVAHKYTGGRPLTVYNRVNLHVAVSLASSLHGYFNAPYRPSSHFYVRKSGVVEQYVDTAFQAEADLEGNDATISIETQGGLTNANGEKWTAKQVKALAKLFVWAVKTHGIAFKVATSSKLGAESKGLSWHRLGIDGNFPATGVLRGRLQRGGGMHYSRARGKLCPGDAKIRQVEEIFRLAESLRAGSGGGGGGGNSGSPTPSKPAPKPPAKPATTSGRLKVDGVWGPATTRRLQKVLGTPVDGVVSSQPSAWRAKNPGLAGGWKWVAKPAGSQAIRALQGRLGVKTDGLIGPNTIKALQRRLGTTADGELWKPSAAIKALQRRLNKNTI